VLAAYHGPHPLDIGVPHFFGFVVGMAYAVTKLNALATDFTFARHKISHLPGIKSPKKYGVKRFVFTKKPNVSIIQ
jgi:hypothetical protein